LKQAVLTAKTVVKTTCNKLDGIISLVTRLC
jgi:hypothetical protein